MAHARLRSRRLLLVASFLRERPDLCLANENGADHAAANLVGVPCSTYHGAQLGVGNSEPRLNLKERGLV